MRAVAPWWRILVPDALGNAGAVANARRACLERERAEWQAEALARRWPAPPAPPERPGGPEATPRIA